MRVSFGSRRITIRDVFAAKRAAGIPAHASIDDEVAAQSLVRLGKERVFARDRHALLSSRDVQPAVLAGSEEEVAPDPVLGVAEVMFPRGDNPAARTFGSWEDQLADLVAMGAGHARRLKFADVYWGSVFPADPGSDSHSRTARR